MVRLKILSIFVTWFQESFFSQHSNLCPHTYFRRKGGCFTSSSVNRPSQLNWDETRIYVELCYLVCVHFCSLLCISFQALRKQLSLQRTCMVVKCSEIMTDFYVPFCVLALCLFEEKIS